MLEHIVNGGNRGAGFFVGEQMNVSDVGDGKSQLETDADAYEYQADKSNVRHFKIKA